MSKIHRPSIPIGQCATLVEASVRLGGSKTMLIQHRRRGTEGFPKMVADFGTVKLYAYSELEAFYRSMIWRQADRSIKELVGE